MPTSNNTAKRRVELGPTGERVRENIQRLRKAQRLTHAELVARMKEAGYSMPRTALSEIENGGRRVSVDDLTALAGAFDVPPNTLLFPDRDPEDALLVTGLGEVEFRRLWKWANGVSDLRSDDPDDRLRFLSRARPAGLAEADAGFTDSSMDELQAILVLAQDALNKSRAGGHSTEIVSRGDGDD